MKVLVYFIAKLKNNLYFLAHSRKGHTTKTVLIKHYVQIDNIIDRLVATCVYNYAQSLTLIN